MKKHSMSRREFMHAGVGAAAAGVGAKVVPLDSKRLWASPGPVAPSDLVRFGIIGCGTEGCVLLRSSLFVPGAECVAAADLYDARHNAAKEALDGIVPFGVLIPALPPSRPPRKDIETTRDYRRILDRKDIDAIIVAAPDHWHRKLVVDALEAGKDVYCEKPMSHSAEDGLAMIEAVRKHNRILQVGSQRVSSILYAKAKEIWDSGKLGLVDTIEAVSDRNNDSGAWVYPIPPDASEQTIDWTTWLGDAPRRSLDLPRFFRWRCFKDYGAGLAGDLFVHLLSGIHFVTGTNMPPQRALSTGGLYCYKDGRDFPDLLWTMYDYPGFQVVLRCNHNNDQQGEVVSFFGKKGTMLINDTTVVFKPQAPSAQAEDYSIYGWPENLRKQYLEKWYNEHPNPAAGRFAIAADTEVYTASPDYNTWADHEATFFNAVRTRHRVIEDEVFGNHTALGCHMANYSYFNKTAAVWDDQTKRFTS